MDVPGTPPMNTQRGAQTRPAWEWVLLVSGGTLIVVVGGALLVGYVQFRPGRATLLDYDEIGPWYTAKAAVFSMRLPEGWNVTAADRDYDYAVTDPEGQTVFSIGLMVGGPRYYDCMDVAEYDCTYTVQDGTELWFFVPDGDIGGVKAARDEHRIVMHLWGSPAHNQQLLRHIAETLRVAEAAERPAIP